MLDVHQPGRRAKLCPVDFLPAAHAADKLKRKVTSVADYRDKKDKIRDGGSATL